MTREAYTAGNDRQKKIATANVSEQFSSIPYIKGRDFYPNLAQVRKGIEIAHISLSIDVTP